MIMTEVEGYKVLPVKFSSTSSTSHELFIKKHSVHKREEDKPVGRTLFVANVPPYASTDSLKNVFSAAGTVDNVLFQDALGAGFRNAYVVFKKESSVSKALRLERLDCLSTETNPVPVEMKKWIKDYNDSFVDHEKLQESMDKFMAEYDKEVEAQKLKDKDKKDDEGWTVVTKKGRNPGNSRKETVKNRINEKINKKRKKKELKNFYTFQIRESKMNRIAKMREKLDEDKKRINAFKQARKFKPF